MEAALAIGVDSQLLSLFLLSTDFLPYSVSFLYLKAIACWDT